MNTLSRTFELPGASGRRVYSLCGTEEMCTKKDEMIYARFKFLAHGELEISSWRLEVQQSKGREDEGKKRLRLQNAFAKQINFCHCSLALMISIETSCPACPKDLPCDSIARVQGKADTY